METPDVRDARNVENLLRKATGNKQSQLKRATMCVQIGVRLPKISAAHIPYYIPLMLDLEL
jgi:hypothetical protein